MRVGRNHLVTDYVLQITHHYVNMILDKYSSFQKTYANDFLDLQVN